MAMPIGDEEYRNPLQRLYDRLIKEARERDLPFFEMAYDRPVSEDGWWILDIFTNSDRNEPKHRVVKWTLDMTGFAICELGPDSETLRACTMVQDEDVIVHMLLS